jgi:hypothetical protein
MLVYAAALPAGLAPEAEVDLKVIDFNREEPRALGPEAPKGQSADSVTSEGDSAQNRDRSTVAIVVQSALAAAAFYLVGHLLYLYVDRWSDLDVEVIGLPSFDELDRSVSAQRDQWSSTPAIVDSPWRRGYGADSFSDAVRIVEQANACSTPDAQAFLLRAQRVCEYLAPNFPKDSGDKVDPVGPGDSRPASWSTILTMYFQDRYCAGYQIGAEHQFRDVGGSVLEAFDSREDEACFDAASQDFGVYTSKDEPTRSGLLYVEISDRTSSPELYLRSLDRVNVYERAGILEANNLVELMGFGEMAAAKRSAAMVAMCDIYGVCPPLGLIAMSECIPHRCPVDGYLETYLRQENSIEGNELVELWSGELVARREMLVRGRSGPR